MNFEAAEDFLKRAPYAEFLGVRALLHGDEMTLVMAESRRLIGNPINGALHGGAIGAFLELTAVAQLYVSGKLEKFPKTIDVTFDYFRTGLVKETYARAHIVRLGRTMANVRAEAWQDERSRPIAAMHGNFMLNRADGEAELD